MQDTASAEADYRRFVDLAVATETVWFLVGDEDDTAHAVSNASDTDDYTPVLLFWSDEASAKRCQTATFPDFSIERMELFDLLYRWLPGMAEDGALAGGNWTADLVGLETGPDVMLDDLFERMPDDLQLTYQERFETLVRDTGDADE